MNIFKRYAIFGLLVIILLAAVRFWFIKPKEEIKEQPIKDFSLTLNLDNKETQNINVSDQEIQPIKTLIDRFEKYKYQKDFVSAIQLLTPPADENEKGWLDHFLGNDLASINNGSPWPRFQNKDKFHLLAGYQIEKIEKKEGVIYVSTNELRVLDESEEGAQSRRLETDKQELTFEIINSGSGLQISQYYHSKSSNPAIKKYDGFISS